MQKRTVAVAGAILLLVLVGAGACSERGNAAQIVRGGILLRLSTDKAVYGPGEVVRVAVFLENLSSSPIDYTMMSIGEPRVAVYLDQAPFAGSQCLFEEGRERHFVLPADNSAVLDAGQTITREVVWDQQLYPSPDAIQAPSGEYTIEAAFARGTYSGYAEPDLLTVTLSIEIQGSWTITTPESAQSAALALSEVKTWYDEHSGPALVKIEAGQHYLLNNGQWMKVTESRYKQALEYEPEIGVGMAGQVWRVHLRTKLGFPPHHVYVTVDPVTGEVLERTEE